jgi:hypothetical protein
MLTKYTNCEVIEVKSADEKIEGNAKFSSFDHIPKDTYRTKDGYIYVKVRAISSRVNKNFDGWPVNELAGMEEKDFRNVASKLAKTSEVGGMNKLTFTGDSEEIRAKGDYGFRTFVGRPVFIDHNNSDPQRARGVVVDAMLHIENPQKISSDSYWSKAPSNHAPETWIELLLEVDGKSFPKLAKSLLDGKVNAVSMGCNVEYTLCSICNHKAATVEDYCSHIKKKGTTFKTGNVDKVAYEDCYNVNFFEISAVFDPADVTALFTEPVIKHAASGKETFSVGQKVKDAESGKEGVVKYVEELGGDESGHSFKTYKVQWNDGGQTEVEETSLVPSTEINQEDARWLEEIGVKAKTAKNSYVAQDLLKKAFHAGESYHYSPVEMPEFDSIKMAEYLGIEPHDSNMHKYMKVYEEGIENALHGEHNLKAANTETQSLEDNFDKSPYERFSTMNTEKYGESITAPSRIDTLKSDKPCPIGLAGECGLDDESGRCEKCGYQEPPSPLADPDLSKAKAFDRKKEQNKEEFRSDTKSLIDRLKKILSKNEIRSVNSTMNTKKANITLAADVEEVPGDEYLTELGWTVPEKEASASSSATPLVDDGKPASDRPRGEKVISDQTKPVESATKVALGELPGLNQPNGGESTPQYKGDKNNETSEISEHNPAQMAEQYQSVKKEVEQPQFADEGNTKDIKNHNPETMPEQYQSVKKEVEKPQFADEGGTKGISEHHAQLPGKGRESAVLSAIKLADLEVELGLNEAEMKYARVAELENEEPSIVEAKYETLVKIKEAGLGKKETPAKKLASFPSFKGVKESSASSNVGVVPDDAIFN